MKKICYFVVGPASSGTRVCSRFIISHNVFGDYGHIQRLQKLFDRDCMKMDWDHLPNRICFRQSIPHDTRWPPLNEYYWQFVGHGFLVYVLAMMRDHKAMILSQIKERYWFAQNENMALSNLQTAWGIINNFHSNIVSLELNNFFYVPYLSLVTSCGYRKGLANSIKLPEEGNNLYKFDFYNGDQKYYNDYEKSLQNRKV